MGCSASKQKHVIMTTSLFEEVNFIQDSQREQKISPPIPHTCQPQLFKTKLKYLDTDPDEAEIHYLEVKQRAVSHQRIASRTKIQVKQRQGSASSISVKKVRFATSQQRIALTPQMPRKKSAIKRHKTKFVLDDIF